MILKKKRFFYLYKYTFHFWIKFEVCRNKFGTHILFDVRNSVSFAATSPTHYVKDSIRLQILIAGWLGLQYFLGFRPCVTAQPIGILSPTFTPTGKIDIIFHGFVTVMVMFSTFIFKFQISFYLSIELWNKIKVMFGFMSLYIDLLLIRKYSYDLLPTCRRV